MPLSPQHRELRRHLDTFTPRAAAEWLMERQAEDYALLVGLQQLADEDGLDWPDDGEVEDHDGGFATA